MVMVVTRAEMNCTKIFSYIFRNNGLYQANESYYMFFDHPPSNATITKKPTTTYMYIISFTVAIFVFDYGENGDEEGVGFLHKIYPGIFFGDQKGPMSCSPLPVTGKRKINRGCGDRGGGSTRNQVLSYLVPVAGTSQVFPGHR